MKPFAIFFILALLGMNSSLPNTVNAQTPKIADSWDWPLKPWNDFEISQQFGKATYPGKENDYHPGIDIWKKSGETQHKPVYAAANGVVSYLCKSATETMDCQGFGKAVLVSHVLPDGSKVTSFYGHLQVGPDWPIVAKGTEVKKGETIIGYIADQQHCGDVCKGPHLHFGIRKGHFEDPGFPKTQWGYFAVTNSLEFAQWLKPVEFIQEYQRPLSSPPLAPLTNPPTALADIQKQIEQWIQQQQRDVQQEIKRWWEQTQREIQEMVEEWIRDIEKQFKDWLTQRQQEFERTAKQELNRIVKQSCGVQTSIFAFALGLILFHHRRRH